MKLIPRSIAERISAMACFSLLALKPMCQPPRPMAETRSPVLPMVRYGMSEDVSIDDIAWVSG